MSPRWRALSTLVVGTILVIGSTPAALAATFDPGTYGPNSAGGYGHTQGSVTWTSARKFDYDVVIQDVCPGDSHGVAFYWELKQVGAALTYLTPVKGYDTDGCGNGYREWIDQQSWPQDVHWARNISCYLVTGSNSQCWIVASDSLSRQLYNPFTTP